jgi:predicted ribosome quality control (RQC) complex YloA/Tae2 family protein
MTCYADYKQEYYRSISELLENFYYKKDTSSRMKQKTHDLNKLVTSNIDRCIKKREIQNKTLKDIKDREKWKKYGELITSNIYQIQKGQTHFETQDFYEETLPTIKINLDAELTAVENAQRYFNKYNKAKRTFAALQDQIAQNDSELEYLEQILMSLNNSSDEANIAEIHTELTQEGYIKKRKAKKGEKVKKTKPMHYVSSEEFDIYVGKNNIQNDELTLKFASSNDIWLHTKDIPGSHVIIKTKGYGIPEDTILEAAQLAAFFSKGRDSSSVPVDYTLKKNVKKPNGAKPGMVIYEENKTLYVTPDEVIIKSLKEIK